MSNPLFSVKKEEKPKKDSNLVWNILSDLNTYQIHRFNGKRINDTQKLYSELEVKQSGLSSFLLLQFIKNEPMLLGVAEYLNENYKMKIYDMYLFVFFTFMYAEIGNVQWVKLTGKMKMPEDIEILQKHYTIDYHTACRYLDIMSNEDILEIKKIYDPKAKK